MNSETDSELLSPSAATKYRGIVARMYYLGQNRSEIQFAVKELGKEMSSPTQASWTRMKRILRYLTGVPRAVLHYEYQKKTQQLSPGPTVTLLIAKSRENLQPEGMLGTNFIKSWSTNQAVIALSSGESEYYASVKEA